MCHKIKKLPTIKHLSANRRANVRVLLKDNPRLFGSTPQSRPQGRRLLHASVKVFVLNISLAGGKDHPLYVLILTVR